MRWEHALPWILIFFFILLLLAFLSWLGYERWEDAAGISAGRLA